MGQFLHEKYVWEDEEDEWYGWLSFPSVQIKKVGSEHTSSLCTDLIHAYFVTSSEIWLTSQRRSIAFTWQLRCYVRDQVSHRYSLLINHML